MIQPFTTSCLDPQQIIRGTGHAKFVLHASLPDILEVVCPCSRRPPALQLVSTSQGFAPFRRPDGCRWGAAEAERSQPWGGPRRSSSPGMSCWGRGFSWTWRLHLSGKPKPILIARAARSEGVGGHAALSAPTRDLSVEVCTTAAGLIKPIKWLLCWDVWITGAFGSPQSSVALLVTL